MTLTMKIQEIPQSSFRGFGRFEPRFPSKRQLLVSDLIAPDDDIATALVVLDGEVNVDGADKEFSSLSALLRLVGVASADGLIGRDVIYGEGHVLLPAGIIEFLSNSSKRSEKIFVRQFHAGAQKIWVVEAHEFFSLGDVLRKLSDPFGEFFICNDNQDWLLLIRDDSPFIYLYGRKTWLAACVQQNAEYMALIPPEYPILA